MFKHNVCVNTK